jgi:hypothetical protein
LDESYVSFQQKRQRQRPSLRAFRRRKQDFAEREQKGRNEPPRAIWRHRDSSFSPRRQNSKTTEQPAMMATNSVNQ